MPPHIAGNPGRIDLCHPEVSVLIGRLDRIVPRGVAAEITQADGAPLVSCCALFIDGGLSVAREEKETHRRGRFRDWSAEPAAQQGLTGIATIVERPDPVQDRSAVEADDRDS